MNAEFQSKASFIENNSILLWLKHKTLRFTHFIDYSLRKDDRERHMALSQETPFHDCLEWYELRKVSDAGKIRGGLLVMCNGIQIFPTAYQDYGHGKMMQRALGTHEHQ
jgi:hypothetical protein